MLQNRALPESQVSLHDIFLAVSNSVDQPMPPIFTQRFQPAAKGTNPGRWLDHFLNWPDTTRNHALRPLAEHLKLFTPTRAAEQALSQETSDPPPTSGNIAIYPAPDSLGDHTAALIGSFLAQTHTPKATASSLLACDGLDLFPALPALRPGRTERATAHRSHRSDPQEQPATVPTHEPPTRLPHLGHIPGNAGHPCPAPNPLRPLRPGPANGTGAQTALHTHNRRRPPLPTGSANKAAAPGLTAHPNLPRSRR